MKYKRRTKVKHDTVCIGVDTIELVIDTPLLITENSVVFVNSKNKEIGTLVHSQGKTKGYRLTVNLPRCVRDNNIKPFNALDAFKIFDVIQIITSQLKEHFGDHLPELVVRSAEVNATMQLKNKDNIQPMMNMIAGMLLQDRENIVYLACKGKQKGQRYAKVDTLASGMNVESIKLPQNSSCRFSSKIYDKSKEQGVENASGIIRVEFIYNRRGLDYAKTGRALQDFLTVESIQSLVECYKNDFKIYFCHRYWNNIGSTPYYTQCIQIIKNDLETKTPLVVALMNRTIVEQDYEFFVKACKLHYQNADSARQAIYRVRKSGEIEIHEGVATEFVTFCREVVA